MKTLIALGQQPDQRQVPQNLLYRIGAMAVIALVGAAVGISGQWGILATVAMVGAFCALLALQHPIVVLYGAILLSSSQSAFRLVSVPVGNSQTTLAGLLWIAFAVIIVLSLLVRIEHIRVPRHLWPFVAFSLWAILRWLATPTGLIGLKEILWYGMPTLIGLYVPVALVNRRQHRESRISKIERLLLYSTITTLLLYFITLSSGLARITGSGIKGGLVGGSRAIPLYMLVVLAVGLSGWRWGPAKKEARFASFWALVIIVLTLGRMAGLLAVGLLVIHRINPRRKWQILLLGLITVTALLWAITNIPTLQDRFFYSEDWDLSKGLSGVNTAGRDAMWTETYRSAIQHPIVGQGLGTARLLLARVLKLKKEVIEQHPHNEYLQAFHDLGAIGVILMTTAWVSTFVYCWRSWERSRTLHMAKWSMAATLSCAVVLVSAVTDNTIHYANVVAPAMIVVGIAALKGRT